MLIEYVHPIFSSFKKIIDAHTVVGSQVQSTILFLVVFSFYAIVDGYCIRC